MKKNAKQPKIRKLFRIKARMWYGPAEGRPANSATVTFHVPVFSGDARTATAEFLKLYAAFPLRRPAMIEIERVVEVAPCLLPA